MTTEKERLLKTLFETPKMELVNIKFFRTEGLTSVSEEQFCEKVNHIIFRIDNGLTDSKNSFLEDSVKVIDVSEISNRLLQN